MQSKVVIFDYSEVQNKNSNLGERIEKAFGKDGLGFCIVKGVPGYTDLRAKLLPLS